jgi:CubicO group peptidase (beta-lactamase class C family)
VPCRLRSPLNAKPWEDKHVIVRRRPLASWPCRGAGPAILGLMMLALAASAEAQAVVPGADWPKENGGKDLGWSADKLIEAHRFMQDLGSTSAMIIQKGQVVAAWGDVTRRVRIASIRKSILSALYGIAVQEGKINPEARLEDVGIDDKPPALTQEEKRARIGDLLRARSGVYHDATSETEQQQEQRPVRGSHPPGTHWYYNNWDFNALGTIYRKQTGEDIFEAVERRIAKPIGMQDFTPADGRYVLRRVSASIHPAYHMNMSARDLARFGLLYLNKGRWHDRQVLPEAWVAETTRAHSVVNRQLGYGYMWWVSLGDTHFRTRFGPGAYSARGYGGQLIVIAPVHDLVIVHLTETFLEDRQYGELLNRIMAAAPLRR